MAPQNSDLPNDAQDEELEQSDAVIGKAFFGSIAVFALVGLIGLVAYLYLGRPKKEEVSQVEAVKLPDRREMPTVKVPVAKWKDITEESHINFVHVSGALGEKLLPETMGSGCAFLDFDNDGDQDILLINACHWDKARAAAEPSTLKLFANDGKGVFSDATEQAGLGSVNVYGMGVACGDYDNDSRVDLFISCLGFDMLFHNEGGKFVDVTQSAGVAGDAKDWSVSSGWSILIAMVI